jgi:protein-disulfide isomerase
MEEHNNSTPEHSSDSNNDSNDSNFPTMNSNPGSSNDSSDEGATFTMKKSTVWKMATFIFAGLFVISFFGILDGGPTGEVIGGGDNGGAGTPPPAGEIKVTISSDDPVLGDADAPISIVEFSDFQCPFCARAANGAIADFKNSDYFKDGEVNLVFKQFPLNSIHPQAQKAAEASECANDQGKFWEYHDLLFLNQNALDLTSLKSYAGQLGLNQLEFDGCLSSGEKASSVKEDLDAASAAGGRGTPYFVIVNEDGDTQTVSGAVPWANFEGAIASLQ